MTPAAFLAPSLLFLLLGIGVVLRGARARHPNHHRQLVAAFLLVYVLAWAFRFAPAWVRAW